MAVASYDAVIIGAGPGGSAAATFLARAGRRVLVLEKEIFPRFHIGESLLPYNRRIFEEMGVLPKLEAAGLIVKDFYWRWPERNQAGLSACDAQAGNAIDFFVQVMGMSFHDAMRQITGT